MAREGEWGSKAQRRKVDGEDALKGSGDSGGDEGGDDDHYGDGDSYCGGGGGGDADCDGDDCTYPKSFRLAREVSSKKNAWGW